jgi:predicted AlkP superfamily pyrophosphatase or phosphodiesterase
MMLLRSGLTSMLTALFCAMTLAAEVPAKKVLVIGTDGTRLDALERAKTPELDRLAQNGTLFRGTKILDPQRKTKPDTVSGPGWSNILTGVWPDKHGVMDNEFKGSKYDAFPHFFARIKQHNPKANTASFSAWDPIAQKIVSSADVSRDTMPGDKGDWDEADEESTELCIEYLKTADPTAVMLYLGVVDETGHAHGFHPLVPKYISAIERTDARIGRVVAALQQRPHYRDEDWLILVATDHGGVATKHGGCHDLPEVTETFLIVNGPSAQKDTPQIPTRQVDVVATALTHLSIPLQEEWKLDGRAVGLKP